MTSAYDTPAMDAFLAALHDVLDVPEPVHHADDPAELRLLIYRAQCARIALNSLRHGARDNTALRTEAIALLRAAECAPAAYPALAPVRAS